MGSEMCIRDSIKKARKSGKLPEYAAEVLEEVRTRLARVIRETPFQRQDRLDKEFEALQMGKLSHAEFRSLFEEKVEDMEDAKLSMATCQDTLKRKYLSKLPHEFRRSVLSQLWPLDGEDKQPRRPNSWEEVADAVEMEMENRADTQAPTDGINLLQGTAPPNGGDGVPTAAPTRTCNYCHRTGHPSQACPKKAADTRGESAKALADAARTGRVCTICGFGDHREDHHRLANADANYLLDGYKV